MRRKSTRNATKTQEKVKTPEQPTRKSRRTSKRRRKSTSSDSEKSEEEQEQPQMTVDEHVPSDTEVVNSAENETEKESPPVERKTRQRKSTALNEEAKQSEEGEETPRNANRRNVQRETVTKPDEEDATSDGEGITDKGKSKGKTRAKVECETTDASGTVTESEICTNAQVTSLSPPQTDIDNAVTCESLVTQCAADNSVDDNSTVVDQERDRRSDDRNDDDDVDKSVDVVDKGVDVVDSSINDNTTQDINTDNTQTGEGGEIIGNKSPQSNTKQDINISNVEVEHGKSEIAEMQSDTVTDDIPSKDNISNQNISKEVDTLDIPDNDKSQQNETNTPSPHEESHEKMDFDQDQSKNVIEISICTTLERDGLNLTEDEHNTTQEEPKTEVKTEELPEESKVGKEDSKIKTRTSVQQKIKIKRGSTDIKETQPRRKWGNSMKLESPEIIDTDLVMTVYPSVQFIEESEVKLEHDQQKSKRYSSSESFDGKSDRRKSLDFDRQTSDESKTDMETEDKSNIIAFNRKISIIDDSATTLKPPPSPAKNPVSDTLFITNLVRPFTLKQLRELLERTGKIRGDCFWTDRIKSKCYVRYETEEEARATREALHGVHWPIGNGKKLMIEYSSEEELANAKNPPAPPPQVPVVQEPSKSDKENEDLHRTKKEETKSKERDERETRRREHVREWDVGKEDLHKSKSDHEHDRRKHSRRSLTPRDDYISKKRKKTEEQIPQKLMDDLFQKTKATPSVYWQPLTPEEIATKQQQRLERMAEHKKRMEETSRARPDYGRGAPYRRKYD